MITMVRNLAALLAVTVGALILAGCDEIQNDQRLGQVLPRGSVKKCPVDCVAYVTAKGDTLYSLGEKFYGKGYKCYLILNRNQQCLKQITLPTGLLKPGYILFLPPDEQGRPIDTMRPRDYWLGGAR
jgi:hypothetical protein